MRKIIDGKMYNTETATKVAEWSNDCFVSDFSYFSETLYRKRTGEYFVYGEGGPMSPWAEPCGSNGWKSASDILPVSKSHARKWMEKHAEIEEYIAEFGEPEE